MKRLLFVIGGFSGLLNILLFTVTASAQYGVLPCANCNCSATVNGCPVGTCACTCSNGAHGVWQCT